MNETHPSKLSRETLRWQRAARGKKRRRQLNAIIRKLQGIETGPAARSAAALNLVSM